VQNAADQGRTVAAPSPATTRYHAVRGSGTDQFDVRCRWQGCRQLRRSGDARESDAQKFSVYYFKESRLIASIRSTVPPITSCATPVGVTTLP